MSMEETTEEGYGYKLFCENYSNFSRIIDFIVKHHEKLTEELKTSLYQAKDNDELEDELEELLGEPAALTIAEIINQLENKEVMCGYRSCDDTDQPQMIGIMPNYPWHYHRMPQDVMTKEECNELLNRYAEILGITEKADYFLAHYYG